MKPLTGVTVTLTRERSQAEPLRQQLEQLGADVRVCPLLHFERPDDPGPWRAALANLRAYDWLVFTSANGVRFFFEKGVPDDAPLPRVACIGPATRKAVEEKGLAVELVAAESVAEGLLAEFDRYPIAGKRILLARAQEARNLLPDGLRERGALVDVVAVYKTVLPPVPRETFQTDWVVLMSASSARHLRQLGAAPDTPVLAVGPVTASAAREAGFLQVEQAERFDGEGVVAKLVQLCGDRRESR